MRTEEGVKMELIRGAIVLAFAGIIFGLWALLFIVGGQ